jgi:predicted aspartyl protease
MRSLVSPVGINDPIQTRLVNKPEKIVEYNAIWDTGATGTVISKKVVKEMGLIPTGMARVCTANGECDVCTYVIDLILPNRICVQDLKVTEGTITSTEDLLIGMDVICAGDFAVSNFEGKTSFSFRMPSMAKTDYVELLKQQNPSRNDKVGRNDPCPCGSGKKYKKCCGKT